MPHTTQPTARALARVGTSDGGVERDQLSTKTGLDWDAGRAIYSALASRRRTQLESRAPLFC